MKTSNARIPKLGTNQSKIIPFILENTKGGSYWSEPLSLREIEAGIGANNSGAVSTALKRLRLNGAIEREVPAKAGKPIQYHVTELGHAMIKRIANG